MLVAWGGIEPPTQGFSIPMLILCVIGLTRMALDRMNSCGHQLEIGRQYPEPVCGASLDDQAFRIGGCGHGPNLLALSQSLSDGGNLALARCPDQANERSQTDPMPKSIAHEKTHDLSTVGFQILAPRPGLEPGTYGTV